MINPLIDEMKLWFYLLVTQVPPKKTGPSKGMKLAIVLLLVVLVLSSILIIFNYWIPQNQLPQPSPSTFTPKEWMQFLPVNVEYFSYMNMSTLLPIEGLFSSTILFNLTTLGINITIYDITYHLVMQTSDGSIVKIMAVNQTYAEAVSLALENSSLVPLEYHNSTLYAIPPDLATEVDWICVNRGAIVMSSGGDLALTAIKTVVDADVTTFFGNDTLKVAFIMTSKSKENFIFTYYKAVANNTYNVDWLMGGASNSTQLDVRVSYHFQTPEDLNRGYQNITKTTIFSQANTVYTSITFMIGDFTYAHSKIGEVLSLLQ